MTIRIELSPESEAQLAAEAQARGMALEEYAGTLLQEILASPANRPRNLTVERFHAMLDELARDSEGLPPLPTESLTRESFYEGRG